MDGIDHVDPVRRDAAFEQLRRHWDARTLQPGDHERRTTAVRAARSEGDIDAALAGLPPLPATGPVLASYDESGAAVLSGENRPSTPVPSTQVAPADARTGGIVKLPKTTAATIVALLPLLCVVALLVFGVTPLVFLAIPIVAIIVYGPDGEDEDDKRRRACKHRDHKRERQERRVRRREARGRESAP